MATTVAAPENREVVAAESPAAIGQDVRETSETCPLLLDVAYGESSDPAVVCQHAGADR